MHGSVFLELLFPFCVPIFWFPVVLLWAMWYNVTSCRWDKSNTVNVPKAATAGERKEENPLNMRFAFRVRNVGVESSNLFFSTNSAASGIAAPKPRGGGGRSRKR